MHFNRLNTTSQYEDYDEDYDDEETYDEDEKEHGTDPQSKDVNKAEAVPTPGHQQEVKGKLDSYQFDIVAQSIRRFDNYLDFTRGRDSDYAKNKNLRRDDFPEDDYEDRSMRDGGRFLNTGPPRSAGFRGQGRSSPGPSGHLAPPSDRSEKLGRSTTGERRERAAERPRGGRRTPEPDEFEEDYVEETPVNRRRRGGALSGAARNRQRGYDDYDEYLDHGRYR